MIPGISGSAADFLSPYGNRQGAPATGERAGEKGRAEEKDKGELSADEQRQVAELAQTDRKVRQHEQMHIAAGRDLITSGPTYSYETGPDGQRYAVGGEVGIDTSEASTPEETAQKATRIRAAALAPPDPSAQDRHVAALAGQMQAEALQEIARQRQEEARENLQETAEKQGNRPDSPENAPEENAAANAAVEKYGIRAYQSATPEENHAAKARVSGVSVYA
jgi:hypothetical protein